MTDQHEGKIPREIRNTREARDDEPAGFWPPRAVADFFEHALGDLRRGRDRIQYVPHHQRASKLVADAEELMMLLRTERHR
jgi:hypothetical protein